MIKKTFLFLSSLALWSCAPNPPEIKSPDSISFRIETIKREMALDSLLRMHFLVEDLRIDSAYASSESLETEIRTNLLANNISTEGSYADYGDMINKMIDEYLTLNDEDELDQTWELSQSVKVVLNEQGLFGLQSSHYSYTGGAHGNTLIGNQTYRLDNQTLLSLDSLLIPAQKQQFIAFCESKFRQQQELNKGESLDTHGFWFNDNTFYLPENFSYSTRGLSLFYNSYEIAPYAYGIIEITLSSAEIKPYLKGEYLLLQNESASL